MRIKCYQKKQKLVYSQKDNWEGKTLVGVPLQRCSSDIKKKILRCYQYTLDVEKKHLKTDFFWVLAFLRSLWLFELSFVNTLYHFSDTPIGGLLEKPCQNSKAVRLQYCCCGNKTFSIRESLTCIWSSVNGGNRSLKIQKYLKFRGTRSVKNVSLSWMRPQFTLAWKPCFRTAKRRTYWEFAKFAGWFPF